MKIMEVIAVRQLKRLCLALVCIMILGLIASTGAQHARADSATPIAAEPPPATPVPTSAPAAPAATATSTKAAIKTIGAASIGLPTPTPTPTPTGTPTPTPTPKPSLTLSHASAFVGDKLTICAYNFPSLTTTVFKIDGRRISSGTTGRGGGLCVRVIVGDVVEGSHTISATAGKGSASAKLTIQPSEGVSALTVAAGNPVTVSVHGFHANEVVSIRFYALNSTTKYVVLGRISTNSIGTGMKTVVIPRGVLAGSHKLVSYGRDAHAGVYIDVTRVRQESPFLSGFLVDLPISPRI